MELLKDKVLSEKVTDEVFDEICIGRKDHTLLMNVCLANMISVQIAHSSV